jgi:prepilin-type N-terminal cleavage/methylation domain-containing protein
VKPQRGFTLVELMISLVLFSFVVAGVLAVAVALTQGFRDQRSAITAEQAVRVPLDFVADAIRQASPGVTDPSKIVDAATCAVGAITVGNGSGTGGTDTLDIVYASGGIVTSLRTNPFIVGTTTTMTVADATQLAQGDYVLITDFASGHLYKVTNVTGSVLTVAGSSCAAYTYAVGAIIIRAQHATFSIGTVDGNPALMMDPDSGGSAAAEPLAEGIEDMQLAVGIDADGSNGISENGAAAGDDEWYYNKGSESYSGSAAIRAIRVTLIGRTLDQLKSATASFARPAAEDHAAGTADRYRRRLLRAIVEIRNVGGSP